MLFSCHARIENVSFDFLREPDINPVYDLDEQEKQKQSQQQAARNVNAHRPNSRAHAPTAILSS